MPGSPNASRTAADVIDIPLLDHLIVGADGRYYSFREAGVLATARSRPRTA